MPDSKHITIPDNYGKNAMDNHTSLPSGGVGKQQKWKKARSRVKLRAKEKKEGPDDKETPTPATRENQASRICRNCIRMIS